MTAPEPLDITVTESGLTLAGEIDAHSAPSLAEAIERWDGDVLELDMAAIGFIDSSGLRALIEAHQATDGTARTVTITNPSTAVSRLLEISGVDGYLNVRH